MSWHRDSTALFYLANGLKCRTKRLDEHEIHIAELSDDSDTSGLDLEWFLDMDL